MANRTTFTEISDGDELSEGYFNGISGFLAPPLIRNLIRQLQDRSVVFSADGGVIGEAFIDVNGRLNSVNTTNTTAKYNETLDTYSPSITDEASGDATSDPDTFTDVANAFDNDDTTSASKALAAGNSYTYTLGKTFSAKTVASVWVKVSLTVSGFSDSVTAKLQTYDGSVWTDHTTLLTATTTTSVQQHVAIGSSIQGLRIEFDKPGTGGTGTNSNQVYSLEYGDMSSTSFVELDVTTGMFSSTISSFIGACLIYAWETGANIQFKLLNGGADDSGWFDHKAIESFTAFAAEPESLRVLLVPKVSSPTTAIPSILGCGGIN